MAFNSNPGRAEYTASAGQTVFSFVFKIYTDADIIVYQTPVGQTADDTADLLTLTTDYTVSIDGDAGGSVTLNSGATLNDSITLERSLDINRAIEFQTNGDMNADTINTDQNYQTYLIADQEANSDRQLRLPASAQGVSSDLPTPIALNFLQWNQTAKALQNINSLQADGFIWTATEVYTQAEVDALLALKASLTGATFTGQVKGITPVADTDFTNKLFVETAISDSSTLLAEREVTGAAATSIDVTGLDIGTHKSYRVEIDNVNNVASSNIYLFVNGDTTLSNYHTQDLFSISTTTGSQNLAQPKVALAKDAAESSSASISVRQVDGFFIFESLSRVNSTELHNYCGGANASKTNLTQLTFTHSTTDGFGIGSKIRIYRGDA